MNWLGPALQAGAGLLGLFGGGGRSQAQRDADAMMGMQKDAYEALFRQAMNYDPATEDAMALSEAGRQARMNVEQSLKDLNAQFRAGGGMAGRDSLFDVRAQGMTDRAMDPLRSAAAQLGSTRTARRLALLAQAAGGGGSLTQQYLAADQQDRNNDNTGASLGVLAGGLEGLFGRSRPTSAAPNVGQQAAGTTLGYRAEDVANRWGQPGSWAKAPDPIRLRRV